MLKASSQPYVCWRCSAQRLGVGAFSPRLHPQPVSRPARARFTNSASRRGLATVHHPGSNLAERRLPLRERLRQWERENPGLGERVSLDFAPDGELTNNLTRPHNTSMVLIDYENTSPLFAGDEMADLRSDDAVLDPGALVELNSGNSRRPILAVCLGRINGYEQFYTMSGKWFSASGIKTLFVVNNFVTPAELAPVIAALPPVETPIELLNVLQELGEGPSRSAGAKLLRKMLHFTQTSEAVYQANAGTLDASSSFIGLALTHRYLTLHEIADLLLPDNSKHGGKFSPPSLYAVHCALLQDEIFFRPLRYTGHKRSYLFEISPLSEVKIIRKIEKMVREYLDKQGDYKNTQSTAGSPIESFVANARQIIDESRKIREWSPNGIIGPSSKPVRVKPDWSDTDLEILQFIELWASYQKFPRHSTLQTLGSALLRAVGRYEDAKGYVDATGWTFLQEIGWIPPWEISARYGIRFPEVEIKRGGSYTRPFMGLLDRHLKGDTLSHIRKPLGNVTAYCIDDITAREIDDAVSLEGTSNPEEYWVHVHVADPASSFGADTPLAKHAQLISEAIYLPGHLEPMLPEGLIQDRYSLAPGRPCLTFSALVNTDGVVLDEKISANILKSVVYMTYEDAASAIGESRESPYAEGAQWSIGPTPKVKTVNRKMTRPEDLKEEQRNDLSILSKLGKAVQAGRLEKGATAFFQPRPMATVSFDRVKQKESNGFIVTSGDPAIHIHYGQAPKTDLVENAMKLGNEVAARWCYERGIPIPYRTQPHGLRNAALVQQYSRDVLNPLLNSGVRPDEKMMGYMRSLIGLDEVSTTPGPHFVLGSDMYTKATSPLRRFGDLIVHWQIEAALLEENRLQRELARRKDGKATGEDLSFLPFSRARLDRLLPMMRLCEKQARALTNIDGTDQWILQAMIRAWRFKEAPLPETFKMTVSLVGQLRVFGRLDWFERPAILKYDELNDVVLGGDIRVGDVIEVRILDINAHSKKIFVEAVHMLEKSEDKKGEQGMFAPLDDTEIKNIPVEAN
ncbi:hypothetical protein F4802DRAFT_578660 [Xylaria palmicola]|nr:hypothetical protein F4802DRAFT_578660 [Xylaria palmicola]